MPSKTEQFKWQSREQAARDLLQIAYHSPPYPSQIAIQLLQAIRSPIVVPELVAIASDRFRPVVQRFHALRAIAQIDGDIFIPELAVIAQEVLDEDTSYYRNAETKITLPCTNLLDQIRFLVDRHPSNRLWFFEVLTATEPGVVQNYIEKWFSIAPLTDGFRDQLAAHLI